MELLCLIQGIVPTEGLSLTLGVLLKEKWRGRYLVNGTAASHTYGHTSLFAV